MAKEMQILSWDDMELAEGRRVPSTGTVIVGYNGTEVAVDVSDKTRKEFEEFLLPILKAGTKPERPASKGFTAPARPRYHSGGAKRRKQELRDWADAQVKMHPELADAYDYVTPEGKARIAKGLTGQYYYPKGLKEDYREATGIDVDAPIA